MPPNKRLLDRLGVAPIAASLYAKPEKEKEPRGHHTAGDGTVSQADLVYLPNDKGYKYALVVVDVGTGKCDAEPMKEREATDAVAALKKIYERGIIEPPTFAMQVDQGGEFKASFKSYFQDQGILVRYSQTGRHRQQALAENRNKVIGEAIFYHQTAREQVTGTTHTSWTHLLPDIIEAINESAAERHTKKVRREQKKEEKLEGKVADVACKGDNCALLKEGTKVRVKLDNPADYVTGKRLHGTFRAGDIRWSADIKKITGVTLAPGQPPFYHVDNLPVNYTKAQLQVVKEEHKPQADKLRLEGETDARLVHKLLAREKRDNKIQFLVRWYGYPDPKDQTYEPRARLMEQVPDLVKQFEKNMKGKS